MHVSKISVTQPFLKQNRQSGGYRTTRYPVSGSISKRVLGFCKPKKVAEWLSFATQYSIYTDYFLLDIRLHD